ncbi:hypothetical protein [uncultured Jatrophihabitans sp.]|uniref:hypothetical protein n=1 Tax=uncultured Jatrophihabitans sp. TaxID=1610747 RepID=UPI0035CABF93
MIRTDDALSLDVPSGSTLGLGAPVEPGDDAVLCRAPKSAAGTAELIGRKPGFVRVVLAARSGRQLVVNVQVTV